MRNKKDVRRWGRNGLHGSLALEIAEEDVRLDKKYNNDDSIWGPV
ncbi:hypothetical protein [Desulfotalea psychrophila]|nr:hypothetical protein [Desulfotalea psychrophila]